jgi:hypothetical protein
MQSKYRDPVFGFNLGRRFFGVFASDPALFGGAPPQPSPKIVPARTRLRDPINQSKSYLIRPLQPRQSET